MRDEVIYFVNVNLLYGRKGGKAEKAKEAEGA